MPLFPNTKALLALSKPSVVLALAAALGATACSDKSTGAARPAAATATGFDAPTLGSATPKVDILAFLGYECEYSQSQAQALLDLVEKHKADVRLRFVNLPLDAHAFSVVAAKGAVAAYKQKAFPLYYKQMMGKRKVPMSREGLVAWAVEANLDAKKFGADFDSKDTDGIVARDVALAKVMGVAGTPSFLVNGALLQGVQSPEAWEKRLVEEFTRADALLASGTKRESLVKALIASGQPKIAADYARYVDKGEMAPAATVPAKVAGGIPPRPPASGVVGAEIHAAAGPTGGVQIGEPPQGPGEDPDAVWRVAVRADDPRLGLATAPVTLVVFEDMECPFCAKLQPVLASLVDKNKDKLRVVFKHNPLPFHKHAELAAEALEAARMQGKFWEMHDLLLKSQAAADGKAPAALDAPGLGAAADKLGLIRGMFDSALAAQGGRERIEADVEQAAALGARGTPNLFINGRKLVGAKEEAVLQARIDEEFKRTTDLIKAGTPADRVYDAIVSKGKLLDSLASEAKTIDTAGAATRGMEAAAIHIVAFQDFQCPFTARLDPHIAEIEQEFPGRVKVTWMDFPLIAIHPQAQSFAEAGQEALKQGKFWQFHAAVMADNSKLDDKVLLERARKAGMNLKALQDALKLRTHGAAVVKQRAQGEALGVKGTPSVFINGHAFVPQTGFSANTFRVAVRRLLGTR